MPEPDHLLIFGLGYSGLAIACEAVARGWLVTATVRAMPPAAPSGVKLVRFDEAAPAIAAATHCVSTAGPELGGDPVLARYGEALAAAPVLRWAGYLSTTGVYGDRQGGSVDEAAAPAPCNERSLRRLAAEAAWRDAMAERALDLFRLGGIYGPGRSAFDELRAGRARRIARDGHRFGRIHRDDIAAAVLAAASQTPAPGARVLNLVDDAPAEPQAVVEYAAGLLGKEAPPLVPFAEAAALMSGMALSFWAESRVVRCEATKRALGIAWLYPSYREGLAAILAEERLQGSR
jgi:nucleoside-diphosphate-sugar epimerase